MKLVYIWIESYQCLNNQGYLLSSDYKVQFDSSRKKWKVQRNHSLDSVLYGEDISITAIVGDNGVGKSTLMDAVRILLFDQNERQKIKGFLLFEEQRKLYFMKPETYLLDPVIEYERKDGENKIEFRECSEEFGLVYYSDFLDLKYYKEEYEDGEGESFTMDGNYYIRNRSSFQINISTSWLLRKCNDKLLNFFHKDIERQLNFYNETKEKKWTFPLKLPEQLSISLDLLEMKIFDELLGRKLNNLDYKGNDHHNPEGNTDSYVIGLLKVMEDCYQKWYGGIKQFTIENILQWNLFVTYLYNFLLVQKDENENLLDYTKIDNDLKMVSFFETYKEDFAKGLRYLFSTEVNNEEFAYDFSKYRDLYSRLKKLFQSQKEGDFHIKLFIPNNRLYYKKSYDLFVNKEEFFEIFVQYEDVSFGVDFLEFSWGMSSGESSLFNIFARLYDAMKKSRDTESMILLLDELDYAFHPGWQQKILYYLTAFLGETYLNRQFQIIITTHSPVVLSDVPEENVIFMGKNSQVKTVHPQTFGANISSLYYDSFFMKNGSIGDVARNCIVNLLEAIDDVEDGCKIEVQDGEKNKNLQDKLQEIFLKKQNELNRAIEVGHGYNISKLVDSIGEPIWRYKIEERLKGLLEKENTEEDEIKARIEKMRQRQGNESVRKFLNQLLEE